MEIIKKGKYISVKCKDNYSYIIDNVLKYYDIEKYKNTLVYVLTYEQEYDLYDKYDNFILYNVEHLHSFGTWYFDIWHNFIEHYKRKIIEFWDIDIINYKKIVELFPDFVKVYKFVPLRYVERKQIDYTTPKKFDAIQIGLTQYMSSYRDYTLYSLNKSKDTVPTFSIININKSRYSIEELYDEINLASTVLNIPRTQANSQEQVRLGELISMGCNIVTKTNKISYLADYVHEKNFFSENILQEIRDTKPIENVAEKFRNDTESEESFIQYYNKCLDKWYNTDISYFYTVIIAAVAKDSLNETLRSLMENTMFGRMQILVMDVSNTEDIKYLINDTYSGCGNIYYVKSSKNAADVAFNEGIKYSVGKYLCFCVSGDRYRDLYFDFSYDNFLKEDINILVTDYIENDIIMNMLFERLGVGPILQCCLFNRKIIDIQFEHSSCGFYIFSGVLCKKYGYTYRKDDLVYVTSGYIVPKTDDVLLLDNHFDDGSQNWIEVTKNKMMKYDI